jgi:hypothetical protein
MRHPNPGTNEKSAVIGDSAQIGLPLLLGPSDKTVSNAYSKGSRAPGKGRAGMFSHESEIL